METTIEMVYRKHGEFNSYFQSEHPDAGFNSEVYRMALMNFIAELIEEAK